MHAQHEKTLTHLQNWLYGPTHAHRLGIPLSFIRMSAGLLATWRAMIQRLRSLAIISRTMPLSPTLLQFLDGSPRLQQISEPGMESSFSSVHQNTMHKAERSYNESPYMNKELKVFPVLPRTPMFKDLIHLQRSKRNLLIRADWIRSGNEVSVVSENRAKRIAPNRSFHPFLFSRSGYSRAVDFAGSFPSMDILARHPTGMDENGTKAVIAYDDCFSTLLSTGHPGAAWASHAPTSRMLIWTAKQKREIAHRAAPIPGDFGVPSKRMNQERNTSTVFLPFPDTEHKVDTALKNRGIPVSSEALKSKASALAQFLTIQANADPIAYEMEDISPASRAIPEPKHTPWGAALAAMEISRQWRSVLAHAETDLKFYQNSVPSGKQRADSIDDSWLIDTTQPEQVHIPILMSHVQRRRSEINTSEKAQSPVRRSERVFDGANQIAIDSNQSGFRISQKHPLLSYQGEDRGEVFDRKSENFIGLSMSSPMIREIRRRCTTVLEHVLHSVDFSHFDEACSAMLRNRINTESEPRHTLPFSQERPLELSHWLTNFWYDGQTDPAVRNTYNITLNSEKTEDDDPWALSRKLGKILSDEARRFGVDI